MNFFTRNPNLQKTKTFFVGEGGGAEGVGLVEGK